jgi:hypothetical protein
MNNNQKTIHSMVLELLSAMEKYPYPERQFSDVYRILPGIADGSFFDQPFDFQCQKLGWLNGAFFGRGERAIPLVEKGLLRHGFALEFDREFKHYAHPNEF